MKKRIINAKIACLDINLQKTRMQLGVQILVEDPDQLEEIRKRYVSWNSLTLHTLKSNLPVIGRPRLLLSGFVKSLGLGPMLS
jgi:hypothetical protein